MYGHWKTIGQLSLNLFCTITTKSLEIMYPANFDLQAPGDQRGVHDLQIFSHDVPSYFFAKSVRLSSSGKFKSIYSQWFLSHLRVVVGVFREAFWMASTSLLNTFRTISRSEFWSAFLVISIQSLPNAFTNCLKGFVSRHWGWNRHSLFMGNPFSHTRDLQNKQ